MAGRDYAGPLIPPNGDESLIPITLFPNENAGMGYGTTEQGFGYGRPTLGLGPQVPEGYDRTVNMSVLGGRVLSPSFALAAQYSLATPTPPVAIIPWITTGTPPVPFAVILAGNDSYLFQNNAPVLETDNSPRRAFTATTTAAGGAGAGAGVKYATTDTTGIVIDDFVNITDSSQGSYNGLAVEVTAVVANTSFTVGAQTHVATATGYWQRESQFSSACLHQDSQASGTAYLYAGLKTGDRKLLQRRSRAGVWSEAASNVAIFVASSGAKLFATTTNYTVVNWPATDDPITAAPSADIYVGAADAKINSMNSIGGSIICGKEDGVWAYNEADTRFERIYPLPNNPLNCQFMRPDGAGGLYTATADSVLVQIERYGGIVTAHPTLGKPIGRDTPRGRFTGVTVYGNRIFAVMDRGGKITQPAGLCVLKTTDGGTTYTDLTSTMTDQRFDQFLDLTSLDTIANGDWLAIGADDRFLLVDFVINGANRSTARLAVQPANISGGVLGTDITAIVGSALFNGTDASPATTSTAFGQSGQVAIKHTNDLSGWITPGTLTAAPQYTNKFWMKVGLV